MPENQPEKPPAPLTPESNPPITPNPLLKQTEKRSNWPPNEERRG